ncbi:mitotic-spindle organizing protein 1 isoform X1 [Stegostoma tigrinum]|uniref:mitotic-spindle organizing protein 1 isoform X1 n=1 Tax=Stegostoma tigrinum TaxID=3053191 RepID=UPI00202B52FD|nr:mitotic-spindle organizing protein 1 isoform X1 [Stegostoma tigrinum]
MANAANLNAVRETMDVLLEISRLLNTGLDMESLSICVRLCEQGINPEALASVIKELRKAADSLKCSPSLSVLKTDSLSHPTPPLLTCFLESVTPV